MYSNEKTRQRNCNVTSPGQQKKTKPHDPKRDYSTIELLKENVGSEQSTCRLRF